MADFFFKLFDAGVRATRAAAIGGMCLSSGCATLWSDQAPQKYETVATNNRRDVKTAQVKHAEALVLMEKRNPEKHLPKAETLLNEALVADIRYGPAHNSLGMVYYLQDKLYLAAWEFEYAAKLMPDHAEPYNNLGLVYERAGKYEEAISYYSMAMSRDENDPEVMGNLVRARLTTGDKGSDLKTMISDLALNHPNPTWQQWARDEVALAKFDDPQQGLGESWQPLGEAPEALPRPIREPEAVSPSEKLEFPESVAPPDASS